MSQLINHYGVMHRIFNSILIIV